MESTPEPFVPGDYTVLEDINIRASMNTKINVNLKGGYKASDTIKVYEVFAEKDGILWGRVSTNTGEGVARYIGMRVNNHPKVKLTRAFPPSGSSNPADGALMAAIIGLTTDGRILAAAVENLAAVIGQMSKK